MIIDAAFEFVTEDRMEETLEEADYADYELRGVELPRRATNGSAGYDICTPMDIDLEPEESMVVPTFLKCRIQNGWLLWLVPKSGLGFKYFVRLANTCGIVDEDYYNNVKNEGQIFVKIRNEGDKPLHIDAGKAFCQGIFLPYGVCRGEPMPTEIRAGGFGSTGR